MLKINLDKTWLLFISVFLTMMLSSVATVMAEEYVTLERVNLRTSPSLEGEVLFTLDTGSSIHVENFEDGWYKVVYNDKQGYIKSEFVEKPENINEDKPASQPQMEEYVALERVNLRTEPSLDGAVLLTVSTGSKLIIEDVLEDWYKVTYNDTQGYMKAEFVGSPEELKQPSGVELVSWAEAKRIFTIGVAAEIYDVRSGLRYYVKSFSNGNHADVEPVTKDDTNTMLKTFNGRWSWDTRPVLVTINGRTMAASINGMPHGGGINSSNGMDGQVCIHFKDSRTHNGNSYHERDHQNSVMEAYNKSK